MTVNNKIRIVLAVGLVTYLLFGGKIKERQDRQRIIRELEQEKLENKYNAWGI